MWQFRKACHAMKVKLKKEIIKIANVCSGRRHQHQFCTLYNPIKIQNTNICNMQSIKDIGETFLFASGDIELNTGPINTQVY